MKNKIKNIFKMVMVFVCLIVFFGFDADSWISVVAMICSGAWLTYAAWKKGWMDEEEEEGA